jgi:hypothetical protein
VTVDFALFFSPEGIALAHRQAAGHWALVGEASFEGDLAGAMAGLRSAAEARGIAKGRALLVLPDDQVLYTSFMAPADNAGLVAERITEGLEGMTPYAVADLTYDWRAVEVDRVKVAVVAQETLDEATQFAEAHGFKAGGFAAMPPAERFPGIALFGADRPDLPEAGTGMAFGGDDWARMAEATRQAEADAAAEAKAAAEAAEIEAETAAAAPAAPVEETAADAKGDAPAAADAAPPAPEAPGAAPKPAATPEPPVEDEGEVPPAPITDPTLHQTIAPLAAEEDSPAPEEAADKAAPASPKTGAEEAAAPKAEAAPEVVPEVLDDGGETDAPDTAGSVKPSDTGPADTPRDKSRKPAAGGKRLMAEKPEGPAARPARFSPVAAPREDMPPAAASDSDAGSGDTPALRFGARRGKAPKPSAEAGQIVSSRTGRLGFGTAAAPRDEPVLHPDVAPTPRDEPRTGTGTGTGTQTKPGSRLAAQLARVRDASKTRDRATPGASAGSGTAEAPAPMAGRAARDMAEDTAASSATTERGRAGFFRRGGSAAPAAKPPAAVSGDATATAESAFTSGLLARKPVESGGPSFRTGLILTLILLVLLALIAVWSVLFLPDSPMARLFTGDRGGEAAAVSVEDPLDAPAPPAAITAPPAMGLRDTGTADVPGPDTTPEAAAETEEVAALDPGPEAVPPLSDPEVTAGTSEVAEAAPEAEAAQLPDIDAEIELPPLPPLPEEALPSLEETEAIYAADGIWPRTPERPFFEPFTISDDIYVASIDPAVSAFDAVALPPAGVNPGELLRRVPPPPPFGAEIERDARGLVTPTPEGVLSPEGAFVVLGRPPVVAVPRPREIAPAVEEAPVLGVEDAILGTFQPTPRPGDLEETRERQILGGLTVTELAGLRPAERPQSAQEAAAQAAPLPAEEAGAETAAATATPTAEISGTDLAVAQSLLPRSRPGDIAAIVAAAERAPAPVVEARAIAPAPSIPSNADVTRAATERNAICLRDVNLIGVTGTPSDRRALVRLPSGRFVRVGVGDRLDGGRVAAIGEDSLQYVRNGRNITLEIPG